VALCSRSTPGDYLEYLNKRRIGYIIAGDEHVDMRAALEELNARYGVRLVHLDSGGTLNGVMLREGLVDEVHVLVHPCLAGGRPSSIFRSQDAGSPENPIRLELVKCEALRDGIVGLHYAVAGAAHPIALSEEHELVHS
jgi:2,5-diamino-6-(ribosylamino)-4(3H)-pyrimidinone 5'-phosphate reductase